MLLWLSRPSLAGIFGGLDGCCWGRTRQGWAAPGGGQAFIRSRKSAAERPGAADGSLEGQHVCGSRIAGQAGSQARHYAQATPEPRKLGCVGHNLILPAEYARRRNCVCSACAARRLPGSVTLVDGRVLIAAEAVVSAQGSLHDLPASQTADC